MLLSLAAARADDVVDRLSVPGPLTFGGETYRLAWSSHPSPAYYKQEYVPAGQSVEHFERMLLVEALVGQGKAETAVDAKIATLNRRKASDPLVNFAVARNPKNGEIILDFVLGTPPDAKGEDIVEWNAYRYAVLNGRGGNDGVLLFAVSRRAYGEATTEFLRRLKSGRPAEIDALAGYPLPPIRPTD